MRKASKKVDGDYYPFGLTMAGISSKAAGGIENKKKYNGIDWEDDLDLAVYDAFFRELDPQTGRWWQIDPKVDEGYENFSPYVSMYDNPSRFSDQLGDEGDEGECPNCPIIVNPASLAKGHEIASEIGGAIVEAAKTFLTSAGGVLNGALNAVTFGSWGTNPSEVIIGANLLPTDEQSTYDPAVAIGQYSAMFAPPLKGPLPMNGLHLSLINISKTPLAKMPYLPFADRVKIPTAPIPGLPAVVKAHGQKKQSTGSTRKSADQHMRQYKNSKKGNRRNENEKKGARGRRTKNKPID